MDLLAWAFCNSVHAECSPLPGGQIRSVRSAAVETHCSSDDFRRKRAEPETSWGTTSFHGFKPWAQPMSQIQFHPSRPLISLLSQSITPVLSMEALHGMKGSSCPFFFIRATHLGSVTWEDSPQTLIFSGSQTDMGPLGQPTPSGPSTLIQRCTGTIGPPLPGRATFPPGPHPPRCGFPPPRAELMVAD